MGGTGNHQAKQNKPDLERHTLHNFPKYVESRKNRWHESIRETVKHKKTFHGGWGCKEGQWVMDMIKLCLQAYIKMPQWNQIFCKTNMH